MIAETIYDEWLLERAQGTGIAKIVLDYPIIVRERS